MVQIQYGYEGGPITKFPVCGCGCGCGWLIIAKGILACPWAVKQRYDRSCPWTGFGCPLRGGVELIHIDPGLGVVSECVEDGPDGRLAIGPEPLLLLSFPLKKKTQLLWLMADG